MPEYAFDVSLNAVIRVTAKSQDDAREMLEELRDEFDIIKLVATNTVLTAASIDNYVCTPFEIDGESTETP